MLEVEHNLSKASNEGRPSFDVFQLLATSNNASVPGLPIQGLHTWHNPPAMLHKQCQTVIWQAAVEANLDSI